MLAEEHDEPGTNGMAAGDADDGSVTGGSPGQTGTTGDTDGQSVATGVTETRIGGQVPTSPQRSWRLSGMKNIQLCDWMEQMGASKETLEELQRSGTDGCELIFCMDTFCQTNENIAMVEKQLLLSGNTMLCMRLRQRVTSEAEAERNEREQARRMEVQEDKVRLECEALRMQHDMDMQRIEAAAKLKGNHNDSDSDADTDKSIVYDKIVVKMPRAPEVKNIVDGVSGDDWTKFGVGTVAYASQRNEDLGEMYDKVMMDPDTNVIKLLDSMSTSQRKLDQAIFSSINECSGRNIMKFIGDVKECKHTSMYSGLLVCSLVGQFVDHKSVGRKMKLMESVTSQTPIIDARDVAERIIEFKQQLGQCVKFEITMATETIYMGLEKMMAELICRPSLTIHMAGVKKIIADQRGNGDAMMKAIIAAAGDLNELTASAALPTRQSSEYRSNNRGRKGGGKGGDNGSYGVERKEKICISFREYAECRDGKHCNMKHIKPEKECENAEFKKSGFCDDLILGLSV